MTQTEVKIHDFDSSFVNGQIAKSERRFKLIFEYLEQNTLIRRLSKIAIESLEYSVAVKNSKEEILKILELASQAITATELLSNDQINETTLTFENYGTFTIKVDEDFNKLSTSPSTWIDAVYLAILAGNQERIDSLIKIDRSLIGRTQALYDPFCDDYTDFLKSVFFKDDTAKDKLNKTLLGITTEQIHPGVWEFVENNVLSHLKLWESFLNNDKEQFNERLQAALEKHKAYWGSSNTMNPGGLELKDYSEGYFSIPITAICKLAHQSGFPIEVKSDYTPDFLIFGE